MSNIYTVQMNLYKQILNAFVLQDAYSSTFNKSISVEVEYLQWASSYLCEEFVYFTVSESADTLYMVLYHDRGICWWVQSAETCVWSLCTADLIDKAWWTDKAWLYIIKHKMQDCCWGGYEVRISVLFGCEIFLPSKNIWSQGSREFRKIHGHELIKAFIYFFLNSHMFLEVCLHIFCKCNCDELNSNVKGHGVQCWNAGKHQHRETYLCPQQLQWVTQRKQRGISPTSDCCVWNAQFLSSCGLWLWFIMWLLCAFNSV